MEVVNQISKCEVCGANNLTQVLDLGRLPLCDDLIPLGALDQCETYPIRILLCEVCLTAHQQEQVPKLKLFPQSYHYRSKLTNDVLLGMADFVQSVESTLGSLRGRVVLDIGCNDGSLLDQFSQKGAITVGVEPTGASADAEGRMHKIHHDFFSYSLAHEIRDAFPKIDVITFTNVFAHIEHLPGLLNALSLLMGTETILVVENHYLGAVLERNQFDTFYHEHPRTYSLHSFIHIAQTLGKEVLDVNFPHRYGGNIRVVIGDAAVGQMRAAPSIESALNQERDFISKFAEMQAYVGSWKTAKKSEIMALVRANGALVAKAFPGRAAILLGLLGLSEHEIECVYERPNSPKIGHYVPGTKIPIRSDEELGGRLSRTGTVVNLAWHITDEIEDYLYGLGFNGRVVSIM